MRDVKAALGMNLFALAENKFQGFAELLADPLSLVDVLYVLCREQCQRLSMSDEQFGRMFAGDTILGARDAFAEAYVDFFPDAEIRKNLRQLMGKTSQIRTVLTRRAAKQIDELDAEKLADEVVAAL